MSDRIGENGKIVMDNTSKVLFFYAIKTNDLDMVRFRLEQNEDNVNLLIDDGQTTLMSAKSAEMVEMLCKYGAKVNQKDEKGMTALMHAAERIMDLDDKEEIHDVAMQISQLIELGANVYEVDNNGFSALDRVDDELKEFMLEEVEYEKEKAQEDIAFKYVLLERHR